MFLTMADAAALRDWQDIALERGADLERTTRMQQAFFATLAAEMRKPHFGEMQRDWMKSLLNRATEAGLYTPEDA